MFNIKSLFNIIKYAPYLFRKRFNGKYIIIESDDWGLEHSISIEGIDYLKYIYGVEKFTRWTTDSLETVEDVSLLFDLLSKFDNSFEYPPIITTNFVTHNIDYNNSDSITFISLEEYLNDKSELSEQYLYGIRKKYIYPQLHGYCHYDTTRLNSFYSTNEGKELFKVGFFTGKSTIRGNLELLRSEFSRQNINVEKKLKSSINTFNHIFNYNPKSIIPSHFIIDKEYINILCENGIIAIQACNRLITSSGKRYSNIYFRNRNGILWVPRNTRLDPHPDYGYFAESCINNIESAFRANIPAIIDFHRVNIAGRYNPEYRDVSIKELDKVLKVVLKKWPETKFITTEELIRLCQV